MQSAPVSATSVQPAIDESAMAKTEFARQKSIGR